jgi:hypothetical protein
MLLCGSRAAAQNTDLTKLSELLSRIKQAERRFPELPLGTVVAHIDTYRKATLPDDFKNPGAGGSRAIRGIRDPYLGAGQ